jgi:hypothetical protein
VSPPDCAVEGQRRHVGVAGESDVLLQILGVVATALRREPLALKEGGYEVREWLGVPLSFEHSGMLEPRAMCSGPTLSTWFGGTTKRGCAPSRADKALRVLSSDDVEGSEEAPLRPLLRGLAFFWSIAPRELQAKYPRLRLEFDRARRESHVRRARVATFALQSERRPAHR